MKKLLLLSILTLIMVSCHQKPAPTDDDIDHFATVLKDIKDHYGSAYSLEPSIREEYEQLINDSIDAMLGRWDINQASFAQIQIMAQGGNVYQNQHLRTLVYPRLRELAKQNSLEGANAMAMSIVNYPMDPDLSGDENHLNWAKAYMEFTQHPALDEYMNQEGYAGTEIFGRLQFISTEQVAKTDLVHQLAALMDKDMSPMVASQGVQVFDEAKKPEMGLSKDSVNIIREKALALAKKAQIYYADQEQDKRTLARLNFLNGLVDYLAGPAAKGELIGHQAPEISFYWTSQGEVKSLADLKGNVVILDFWATWCGPCVRAFPNVRKLQERYADYPVKIIGVTAIQGYHYDRKNGTRIQLPDEPEREMELMHSFMDDFDMTWTVAFSDDEFNPEFGVRGIPHVAIIDAEGKVRYNELRPYEAPWHEAEKIDALLREAGLPCPENGMEKTNWAEE